MNIKVLVRPEVNKIYQKLRIGSTSEQLSTSYEMPQTLQ